jgi:hypothetical protein
VRFSAPASIVPLLTGLVPVFHERWRPQGCSHSNPHSRIPSISAASRCCGVRRRRVASIREKVDASEIAARTRRGTTKG